VRRKIPGLNIQEKFPRSSEIFQLAVGREGDKRDLKRFSRWEAHRSTNIALYYQSMGKSWMFSSDLGLFPDDCIQQF
jgi:hypothetical protein